MSAWSLDCRLNWNGISCVWENIRREFDTTWLWIIPNPHRCFECQRFGHGQHGQTTCKGCDTCFKCGEEGHVGKSCPKSRKCRNYKGDNIASSKQCPIWIKEKETQKVKTERRISYPEAKKIVYMYSLPKPHLLSYASTLKAPSTKEMPTQTGESQKLVIQVQWKMQYSKRWFKIYIYIRALVLIPLLT